MGDRTTRRSPWLEVAIAMVAVATAATLVWNLRTAEEADNPAVITPVIQNYALEPGAFGTNLFQELTLTVPGREQSLPVRLSYPQGDGNFAVIVFLPGPATYRGVMDWLVEHWVSHGYVVVEYFPTPPIAWKKQLPKIARSADKPDYQLDQLQLVTSILDGLPSLLAQNPTLASQVDGDRIGLVGMGLMGQLPLLAGGATGSANAGTTGETANTTGDIEGTGGTKGGDDSAASTRSMTEDTATPLLQRTFNDERVWAALSLWGTPAPSQWELEWDALSTLSVPTMIVSNMYDRHPQTKAQGWWRSMFEHAPPGGRYLLVVSSSLPVPPSQTSPAPPRIAQGTTPVYVEESPEARAAYRMERLKRSLCMSTTAFWDAYLKESNTALEFLRSDEIDEASHRRTRLEKR